MKHLFLYGPPASGKTTLGKLLAGRLSLEFVDLDAEVEAAAGRRVAEIFAAEGEAAFRARERRALEDVLARDKPAVVALGGGALVDPACRARAEANGLVVFIDCPRDELLARARRAAGKRPLLAGADPAEALDALLARRAAHYASFPHRVAASFDLPGSTVLVGRGIAAVSDFSAAPRQAAVTDSNVARLGYAPADALAIPAGEEHKTLATVESIWNHFLSCRLARDGVVVATGGGVASDLAGFAASAWMRGVKWMSRPTTLLAMVDASTGGKTGCDLAAGKNLVGAFHLPVLVLVDVATLPTLPLREWRCGLAETIKHGVIADPALLDLFDAPDCPFLAPPAADDSAALDACARFVARSLAVKVEVVRRDPFEMGERAKLNLGHTIGHAVETASGFRIAHGEGVAIGLVAEARLAVERLGADPAWPDRLAAVLARAGLPTELPALCTFDALRELMRRDKKSKNGVVRFALPRGPGDVVLHPIPL